MSDVEIISDGGPIAVTLPQQGPRGLAGSLSVGAVNTGAPGSSVIITNSGTPQAAVLDITIPRGADGTNGTNGTNGLGVPAGGAAGQVLTKNTATDNDTSWQTPAAVPSGTVVFTILAAAPAGWLLFADQTIGNTGSGASYANAAAVNVFTALFDNASDANCPLLTSAGAGTTRAAQTNAATAWAANCRMAMPKSLGRALAVAGTGAGLTARALADNAGAETHVLTAAQLPSSGQTVALKAGGTGGTQAGIHKGTTDVSVSTATDATAGSANLPVTGGTDTAHNNMQPTVFLNCMVKL